jgi:hypothetical protein
MPFSSMYLHQVLPGQGTVMLNACAVLAGDEMESALAASHQPLVV